MSRIKSLDALSPMLSKHNSRNTLKKYEVKINRMLQYVKFRKNMARNANPSFLFASSIVLV